ncbi:hypothetical protein BGW39_009632, partial [Mortierella sp. 14UC]
MPPMPELNDIPRDALAHSTWGDMRVLDSYLPDSLALPPMLRLTRFTTSLEPLVSIDVRRANPKQPAFKHEQHIHHTLWLLRRNSGTITHIDLAHVELTSFRNIRDLCRTVSKLDCLRTFRLHSHRPVRSFTHRELETLLLSLPVSLEHLRLDLKVAGYNPFDKLKPEKDDWDQSWGELVPRKAPLHRLRSLLMPGLPGDEMVPFYHTIQHLCPGLKVLELPCSNKTQHDVKAAFKSMKEIELTQCDVVTSEAIQAALTSCEALEVFKVVGHGNDHKNALSLAHAVENEWVCLNLRELDIIVWLTPDGNSPEYLADPSKTWSEEDHRHWDDLGRFYSQIGALTRLEVLDLKAVGQVCTSHDGWESGCFLHPDEDALPGLLTLGDAGWQLGYLSKLGSLTMLQELKGSVVWAHPEVSGKIGKRERFMVSQLQNLKQAIVSRPQTIKYPVASQVQHLKRAVVSQTQKIKATIVSRLQTTKSVIASRLQNTKSAIVSQPRRPSHPQPVSSK